MPARHGSSSEQSSPSIAGTRHLMRFFGHVNQMTDWSSWRHVEFRRPCSNWCFRSRDRLRAKLIRRFHEVLCSGSPR